MNKENHFLCLLLLLLLTVHNTHCQSAKFKIRTIAFYNTENLFDTIDDPDTFDEDYTPEGKNAYTSNDYSLKINNLASVISQIGYDQTKSSPAILGLAEVENKKVLDDLVNASSLKDKSYQIIHFDSPDLRGIDVALIYQEALFAPVHQQNVEVKIWNEKGERIYTRDILWVSGIMDDELIHMIVNHWPSRRGGRIRSDPKRMKAAFIVRQIIDQIQAEKSDAKIVIMGDFNDDPTNKSIEIGLMGSTKELNSTDIKLVNPMRKMYKKGLNTLAYRDGLHLFDQLILSSALIRTDHAFKNFQFYRAGVFNPPKLITQSGKYKGYPFRSFNNNRYVGGFSDHYPVYILLIKEF